VHHVGNYCMVTKNGFGGYMQSVPHNLLWRQ